MAGNAWSIVNSSKARDAAWAALRWTYTKEGQQSPQLEAVSWPPIVAAANSPQWLELFKGTRIADVSKVWESGGHDLLVLPEGDKAWTTMNTPMNAAMRGEIGTRDALPGVRRASSTSCSASGPPPGSSLSTVRMRGARLRAPRGVPS